MAAGVFELVNGKGRKYLTGDERDRFVAAARADPRPAVQTFAATLAHTGARISEVLAIRAGDVDVESSEVRIATLKRRREHWRSVPVPEDLMGSVAEKGEVTPQAKSQCSVERRDRTGAHVDALSDRSPAPRRKAGDDTRSTVTLIGRYEHQTTEALSQANMLRDYYFLCMEREGLKHDPEHPNKACDQEAQEKLKRHLRGN